MARQGNETFIKRFEFLQLVDKEGKEYFTYAFNYTKSNLPTCFRDIFFSKEEMMNHFLYEHFPSFLKNNHIMKGLDGNPLNDAFTAYEKFEKGMNKIKNVVKIDKVLPHLVNNNSTDYGVFTGFTDREEFNRFRHHLNYMTGSYVSWGSDIGGNTYFNRKEYTAQAITRTKELMEIFKERINLSVENQKSFNEKLIRHIEKYCLSDITGKYMNPALKENEYLVFGNTRFNSDLTHLLIKSELTENDLLRLHVANGNIGNLRQIEYYGEDANGNKGRWTCQDQCKAQITSKDKLIAAIEAKNVKFCKGMAIGDKLIRYVEGEVLSNETLNYLISNNNSDIWAINHALGSQKKYREEHRDFYADAHPKLKEAKINIFSNNELPNAIKELGEEGLRKYKDSRDLKNSLEQELMMNIASKVGSISGEQTNLQHQPTRTATKSVKKI